MREFFRKLMFFIGTIFYIIGLAGFNVIIALWITQVLGKGILRDTPYVDLVLWVIVVPLGNIVIYELWRKTFID